ncbi:hypothetical protein EV715DRAFT_213942, partial [Schizophyllum commune]
EGRMAQMGINNGPRHAQCVGWAKSYVKTLTIDDMIAHDEDIIGATSLMWAIMRSLLPVEVIREIESGLLQDWVPRIASRNVADGDGYRITIGERTYSFPSIERGPPTAYISRGYSASVYISPHQHALAH